MKKLNTDQTQIQLRVDLEDLGTSEVATYVASMLAGLRELTGRPSKDLALLDYLLATAEGEAENLSTRIYN